MKKLITLAVLIVATLTAQAEIKTYSNVGAGAQFSYVKAELDTETGELNIYNTHSVPIEMSHDWEPYTSGPTYAKAPWIEDGQRLNIKKVIIWGAGDHTIKGNTHTCGKIASIGECAFEGCTNLTEVVIHATLGKSGSIGGYIEQSAFNGCTSLKKVTFGNDCELQTIDGSAFYGCTALEEISIPISVTSIGTRAFSNCSNLTTVNFSCPALTTINEAAFENCKSLMSIDLSTCTALTQIGKNAFRYCSAARYIKLPNSIVNGDYDGANQAIKRSAFVGSTGSLDLSENTLNDATTIPFINTYFGRSMNSPLYGGIFDYNSFVYLPKTYTGTKPKGGIYDNETNIAYWDGAKWVCPRFEIGDYSAINLKYDVTAEKVIYKRSGISASTAYSVCLPWAPQTSYSADGFSGKYYQLNGVSGSTIYFSEVAEPEANTPYLFITGDDWTASYYEMNGEYYSEAQNVALKATPAEMSITKNGYKMSGTFAELDKDSTAGKYVLQPDASWQKSDEAIDGVTIPTFNAYIVGPESSPSLLSVAFGEVPTTATAIHTKDLDGTEQWYDLHGRRLNAPQRGFNISSKGKKIMIR
ncbi:MAG: leucine-rich repeat domain-containing protein [Paludibacteraceae bacterium]|nr:leucine-rich repeat domain-containing protein [Paludibacteraceae bacterium]